MLRGVWSAGGRHRWRYSRVAFNSLAATLYPPAHRLEFALLPHRRQALPLDGVAVEWSYMFDDTANAHDMNWWFPCPVPNNAVYSSYGESNPFYVWGINVRRRLPSTPLRIMCQPTAAHP